MDVALYKIKVDDVIKGKIEKGASLTIAVPESVNLKELEQLNGSILFVSGPLQGDQRTAINVSDAEKDPVYLLISGRYGAVPTTGGTRSEAIREYLAEGVNGGVAALADQPIAGAKPRLKWAEHHLLSDDTFLQRSSILEMSKLPSDPKVVELLAKAVRSEAVTPQNKSDAVNALQSSNTPQALLPLKELAEDAKVPKALRDAAVKAVGAVPGGREELLKWSNGDDKVLNPAAKSAIQRYEGKRNRSTK